MLIIYGVCTLIAMFVLPTFLFCSFFRPTWTDWFEFALITALWPLSITCEKMWQISLVTVIALTIWNIFVYRKLKKQDKPCGKALLRLVIVPVLFLTIGALCVFTAGMASC